MMSLGFLTPPQISVSIVCGVDHAVGVSAYCSGWQETPSAAAPSGRSGQCRTPRVARRVLTTNPATAQYDT